MKLSHRSFPHPVVGNSDDVPDAGFQATVEGTHDKTSVYIDVDIVCSSTTINELIEAGGASFAVHVECSNTLFRKAFSFKNKKHRITIPRDDLNDDVEVNTFVYALADIASYVVDGAHPDYADASFRVEAGDILAVGEGCVIQVETNFESTARVGSILQVRQGDAEGEYPMLVDLNGDKIVAILSKNDFSLYRILKAHESLAGPLATSIVLPVVIEALHSIKGENLKADDGRRWVRALIRRMMALGLDQENDLLVVAQKLLELPIRRALAGAKQGEEK